MGWLMKGALRVASSKIMAGVISVVNSTARAFRAGLVPVVKQKTHQSALNLEELLRLAPACIDATRELLLLLPFGIAMMLGALPAAGALELEGEQVVV